MIKRYKNNKTKRAIRTRSKVARSSKQFRLGVNRSNRFVYAQIVDLLSGKTVTGVRSKDAKEAGKEIANKAKETKIKEVVFDKGPYKYHGKIKQLADSAREAGLDF